MRIILQLRSRLAPRRRPGRSYAPPDTAFERYRRARLLPVLALLAWIAPIVTPLLPRPANAQEVAQASGGAASGAGAAGMGSPEGMPASAAGTLANATVEPATGGLLSTVPFQLPKARGAVQPSLSLAYSSRGTFGVGGQGWSLAMPSIERHNPSGPPSFNDPAPGGDINPATQDRFTFGGEPLVHICYFSPGTPECYDYQSNDPSGNASIASGVEKFPSFTRTNVGWHYYRLRTETGANMRFFWSYDHTTWVVQSGDGSTAEYGKSLDQTSTVSPIATDNDANGNIFRWNLVKTYDSQRTLSGAPANPNVYVWRAMAPPQGGTLEYLTDIYDTSTPGTSLLTVDSFAHHTHLVYASQQPQLTASPIAPVWKALPTFLLQRVDIASEDITGTTGRQQARRYYLTYNNGSYDGAGGIDVSAPPVLSGVQLEGDCAGAGLYQKATTNNFEQNGQLADPASANSCVKSLVTASFTYSAALTPSSPPLARGTVMPSLSGAATKPVPLLFDMDNDGLPDVVDTQAGNVWINSGAGFPTTPQTISLAASTLDLTKVSQIAPIVGDPYSNPGLNLGNVPFNAMPYATGSFQADGRVDLLWRGFSQATTSSANCTDPQDPSGMTWSFCDSTVPYSLLTPSLAVTGTSSSWILTPTAGAQTGLALQTEFPAFGFKDISTSSIIGSVGGETICAATGVMGIMTQNGTGAFVEGSGAGSGQPPYQNVVMGNEYPIATLDFDGDGLTDSFNAINYGYLETDEAWDPGASTYYCDHSWYQNTIRFSRRDFQNNYYPFTGSPYSAEPATPSPPAEPSPRYDVCLANPPVEKTAWTIVSLPSLPPGSNPVVGPYPGGSDGQQVTISINTMAYTTSPVDLDGDGILDLVEFTTQGTTWWPGHGDGNFGLCPAGFGNSPGGSSTTTPEGTPVSSPVQCTCAEGASVPIPSFVVPSAGTVLSVHDVTGDGHGDIIVAIPGGFKVYQNLGYANGTITFSSSPYTVAANTLLGWNDSPDAAPTAFYFADMNGSGVDDIIVQEIPSGGTNATRLGYIDLFGEDANGAGRPGMLETITSGSLGSGILTTTIDYQNTSELAQTARSANLPWGTKMPQPIHAVSSLTTATSTGNSYTTTYTYANPVFDAHDNTFLGFTFVRQSSPPSDASNNPATQMDVDTTYFYATCNLSGWPCSGSTDYVDASYRALPTLVEVHDNVASDYGADGVPSTTYISTTHHSYASVALYQGTDGISVRRVYDAQTDTYLYDTSPFTQAQIPEYIRDTDIPGHIGFFLRGASPHHIQRKTSLDSFGNVQTVTDNGDVGDTSSSTPDTPIVSTTNMGVPVNVDAGNNWIFRPQSVSVGASATDPNARVTTYKYDPYGNVTDVLPVLTGTTTSLPRVSLGAPLPATMSANAPASAPVAFVHIDYDTTTGTGNVFDVRQFPQATTGSTTARCTQYTYDNAYALFPTQVQSFIGDCNSPAGSITTNTQYDGVLQVPTKSIAPNNADTEMAYDDFGRIVSIAKPDPANPAHPLDPTAPTTTFEYLDRTFGLLVHKQELGGTTPVGESGSSTYAQRDTYVYKDGLGRTIQVVSTGDNTNQWVLSGQVQRDGRGRAVASYIPSFVTGTDGTAFYGIHVVAAATGTTYDAFSRVVQTTDIDAVTVTSLLKYHALSTELRDAEQAATSGAHIGAYTLTRRDGHGRAVEVDQFGNGTGGEISTISTYQATGEVTQIVRRGTDSGGTVSYSRSMYYDTLGRLVQNIEPNTSVVTSSGLGASGWTYAYDDLGDLVATSDARGCGENFAYDGAGRLLSEDYSPCVAAPTQPAYSAPQPNGDGTEAYYLYEGQTLGGTGAALQTGNLSEVYDRGAHTSVLRDGRERIQEIDKQLAVAGVVGQAPAASTQALATRYAATTYKSNLQYDERDRLVSQTTGADELDLWSTDSTWAPVYGTSMVVAGYSARGFLQTISSSYGAIITGAVYEPDGRIDTLHYGDAAKTTLTNTYNVDPRHRLTETKIARLPESFPTEPATPTMNPLQPTQQLTLADDLIPTTPTPGYDKVSNPTEITDNRNAGEWPSGYEPVSRSYVYDDSYRLTKVQSTFSGAADPDAYNAPVAAATAATSPFPIATTPRTRVTQQTFSYDGLGDILTSTDSSGTNTSGAFYDRSLGTLTHSGGSHVAGGTATGTNQLTAAALSPSTTSSALSSNKLDAVYDAAGNLVQLQIWRTGGCTGSSECNQILRYDWDELGRLSRARRFDVATPELCHPVCRINGGCTEVCVQTSSVPTYTYPALPASTPNADVSYAYDASGTRVLRASTPSGQTTPTYSGEIFPSLRFDHASWSDPSNPSDATASYETTGTEIAYLTLGGAAYGRVVSNENLPNIAGMQHVFLELTDSLGSTTVVIDKDTGELVERTTYLPYGAVETDYRPDRWSDFREDYKFTGKEDDVEIGLTYFGARYYSPQLGQWISPDPATIHGASGDLNPYAYVGGHVTMATDPDGLDEVPLVIGTFAWPALPAPTPWSPPPMPAWMASGPWANGGLPSFADDDDDGEGVLSWAGAWAGVGKFGAGAVIGMEISADPASSIGAGILAGLAPPSPFTVGISVGLMIGGGLQMLAGGGMEEAGGAATAAAAAEEGGSFGAATPVAGVQAVLGAGAVAAGAAIVARAEVAVTAGFLSLMAAARGGGGGGGRVDKVKGPEFPDLKDHAARHGNGLSTNAYYNQAVAHTQTGTPFRVYHDGEFKQAYITRLGSDSFRYTATDLSGNTIFTHMDVNGQYLSNVGITLPQGF